MMAKMEVCMIALIDYGAGNVGSVLKAIRYLGYDAAIADSPEQLERAAGLIFPGQGHFAAMMQGLAARGLLDALGAFINSGKPFLGICLGLQALYEGSDEAPGVPGLGLLPGRVTRFRGVFKVPHVGWSQLEISRPTRVLRDVKDGSFVYFCHSYYGPVTAETVGATIYGQQFASVIEKGNVWSVQFHPEKSGQTGLAVLSNFLGSCSGVPADSIVAMA
jgi:imidazole glycerol phosphate synthase glutamine amidotransferase subunit